MNVDPTSAATEERRQVEEEEECGGNDDNSEISLVARLPVTTPIQQLPELEEDEGGIRRDAALDVRSPLATNGRNNDAGTTSFSDQTTTSFTIGTIDAEVVEEVNDDDDENDVNVNNHHHEQQNGEFSRGGSPPLLLSTPDGVDYRNGGGIDAEISFADQTTASFTIGTIDAEVVEEVNDEDDENDVNVNNHHELNGEFSRARGHSPLLSTPDGVDCRNGETTARRISPVVSPVAIPEVEPEVDIEEVDVDHRSQLTVSGLTTSMWGATGTTDSGGSSQQEEAKLAEENTKPSASPLKAPPPPMIPEQRRFDYRQTTNSTSDNDGPDYKAQVNSRSAPAVATRDGKVDDINNASSVVAAEVAMMPTTTTSRAYYHHPPSDERSGDYLPDFKAQSRHQGPPAMPSGSPISSRQVSNNTRSSGGANNSGGGGGSSNHSPGDNSSNEHIPVVDAVLVPAERLAAEEAVDQRLRRSPSPPHVVQHDGSGASTLTTTDQSGNGQQQQNHSQSGNNNNNNPTTSISHQTKSSSETPPVGPPASERQFWLTVIVVALFLNSLLVGGAVVGGFCAAGKCSSSSSTTTTAHESGTIHSPAPTAHARLLSETPSEAPTSVRIPVSSLPLVPTPVAPPIKGKFEQPTSSNQGGKGGHLSPTISPMPTVTKFPTNYPTITPKPTTPYPTFSPTVTSKPTTQWPTYSPARTPYPTVFFTPYPTTTTKYPSYPPTTPSPSFGGSIIEFLTPKPTISQMPSISHTPTISPTKSQMPITSSFPTRQAAPVSDSELTPEPTPAGLGTLLAPAATPAQGTIDVMPPTIAGSTSGAPYPYSEHAGTTSPGMTQDAPEGGVATGSNTGTAPPTTSPTVSKRGTGPPPANSAPTQRVNDTGGKKSEDRDVPIAILATVLVGAEIVIMVGLYWYYRRWRRQQKLYAEVVGNDRTADYESDSELFV